MKISQNIWRAKRRVRRYVSIAQQMIGDPAFVSFTYTDVQKDMPQAIQDWSDFTRRLKKALPNVALIRVPERHKSGGVHFHAAMFGLPENLPCQFIKRGRWFKHACAPDRPCERKTRVIAKIWGKGFVDVQESRSPERVGAYIAKYLTKGDPDWSMFGLHIATCNSLMHKTIAAAKRAGIYFEMSTYKSPVAVDMTLDDLTSRMHLRQAREFETKWLGKAHYKVFDINTTDENIRTASLD